MRCDPRWPGIVDVLVSSLNGEVHWETDSVVLQLPDYTHPGGVGDLDALWLCLGRVGVPVLFDESLETLPSASLIEFRRQLRESGLRAEASRAAA